MSTPEKKEINVHQFFPQILSGYKIDPTLMFYDEDSEEEEGGEEEAAAAAVEGESEKDKPAVDDRKVPDAEAAATLDESPTEASGRRSAVADDDADDVALAVEKSLSMRASGAADAADEDNANANNNAPPPPPPPPAEAKPIFATAVSEEAVKAAQDRREAAQKEAMEMRSPMDNIVSEKVKSTYREAAENIKRGDHRSALAQLSKVVLMHPQESVPYAQRAECYLALTDFQSAILNLKKACLLEPADSALGRRCYNRLAFVYFLQGQCMFDQKMFAEALEAFSQAAEMRPDKEGYHTRSIACLAALDRHGECLALVNKRLEEEKTNADLYVMRARLHTMFKNISLCYYDVKDALEIDPEHVEAGRMLAGMEAEADRCHATALRLNLQGRLRDATEKISSAIEYNPTRPEYHVIRGALNRRQGQYSAAVDDYLLALDKTDHDERSAIYAEAQRQLLLAYNDFAVECFKKGMYREAVVLLDKAIKGEKNEKGLYMNRGDCFFRMGDYQFALADYQQTLELDPSDESVRGRISVIYNEFGSHEYGNKNYSEAEAQFTLAIQSNPRIAHYYLSRARARYMMESYSEAREDLVAAMLLDQSNEEHLSLSARLFPGKTAADILSSAIASYVRESLAELRPAAATSLVGLRPPPHAGAAKTRALEPGGAAVQAIASAAAAGQQTAADAISACMSAAEFHTELTKSKKKVSRLVKGALHERKSLRYTGPRIQPLPEAAAATSGPTAVSPGASGWRKFRRGIGVRNN